MQHHGPNNIAGPVRGTRGWWQRLGQLDAAPPKTSNRRTKKTRVSAGIRVELVARVRREIAAGTYDTPEKWEETLDRLLDHLSDHE